jgi:hypothetical protein
VGTTLPSARTVKSIFDGLLCKTLLPSQCAGRRFSQEGGVPSFNTIQKDRSSCKTTFLPHGQRSYSALPENQFDTSATCSSSGSKPLFQAQMLRMSPYSTKFVTKTEYLKGGALIFAIEIYADIDIISTKA